MLTFLDGFEAGDGQMVAAVSERSGVLILGVEQFMLHPFQGLHREPGSAGRRAIKGLEPTTDSALPIVRMGLQARAEQTSHGVIRMCWN
jgi:hypothetical protein